jgi:acid phosphatase
VIGKARPAVAALRAVSTIAALGLVLVSSGCGGGSSSPTIPTVAPPSVRIPDFTHVVLVMFENETATSIVDNPAAPTFNALARRYARLTRYYAVAHPSLPNYLALVSGSTNGITSDCTDCVVHARSLADALAAGGKTWKTYAEGLPSPGFTGAGAGLYAKKHDPFLYFAGVAASRAERDHVVPFTELAGDLAAHRLPDFSLVVPNLCDDMHSCPIQSGDAWLKAHIVPLLSSPELRGGVIFVVFDEGEQGDDAGGGGHVDALALGSTVKGGSTFAKATNHYGLLRTIEDAWSLPRLGFSRTATPIGGIWQG